MFAARIMHLSDSAWLTCSSVCFVAADFLRAWVLLLEHTETSALCNNAEVSLAALKSFQELLQIGGRVIKAENGKVNDGASTSQSSNKTSVTTDSLAAGTANKSKKPDSAESIGATVDGSADSQPMIDAVLFQTLMNHAWKVKCNVYQLAFQFICIIRTTFLQSLMNLKWLTKLWYNFL